MKTPVELMALPYEEACAIVDALTDEERVALRRDTIDWLADELSFVITHGRRRRLNETLETDRVR